MSQSKTNKSIIDTFYLIAFPRASYTYYAEAEYQVGDYVFVSGQLNGKLGCIIKKHHDEPTSFAVTEKIIKKAEPHEITDQEYFQKRLENERKEQALQARKLEKLHQEERLQQQRIAEEERRRQDPSIYDDDCNAILKMDEAQLALVDLSAMSKIARRNKEVVMKVLAVNDKQYFNITEVLKNDVEIACLAVSSKNYEKLPWELLYNKEVLLALSNKKTNFFPLIHLEKMDDDTLIYVMMNNPKVLKHVPKELYYRDKIRNYIFYGRYINDNGHLVSNLKKVNYANIPEEFLTPTIVLKIINRLSKEEKHDWLPDRFFADPYVLYNAAIKDYYHDECDIFCDSNIDRITKAIGPVAFEETINHNEWANIDDATASLEYNLVHNYCSTSNSKNTMYRLCEYLHKELSEKELAAYCQQELHPRIIYLLVMAATFMDRYLDPLITHVAQRPHLVKDLITIYTEGVFSSFYTFNIRTEEIYRIQDLFDAFMCAVFEDQPIIDREIAKLAISEFDIDKNKLLGPNLRCDPDIKWYKMINHL